MQSSLIRQKFLDFFAERGHEVRPSASLIPVDPTLLLTNAGMVPFKPYFLGEEQPPFDRAVSAQKVARTVDIEVVGTTVRHFTFFEMLGNFSFGDYFKEQAIPWAYELSTEVLGLDPDRLWFTVHESDDEASAIWLDVVGVDPTRLQRRGRDNFWQMGVPGPCGPCSEIFYDRGPEHGPDGGPVVDEERFCEFWNLVFMQFIQDDPYHVIGDLPARSIDTGMGLERVAMLLQGCGERLRDGCRLAGAPGGCLLQRCPLRRIARSGRGAADPGRPRPLGHDAHRRWGGSLERRPGVRPAADPPPCGAARMAARG